MAFSIKRKNKTLKCRLFSTYNFVNSTLKYSKNYNFYRVVEQKSINERTKHFTLSIRQQWRKLKQLYNFKNNRKRKMKALKRELRKASKIASLSPSKLSDYRLRSSLNVSRKELRSRYFVYIESNYHNIKIFVYNKFGNCLFWSSGGSVGFKGRKKGSPFVGRIVADSIIKKFKGLKKKKTFSFFFKGFGPGRKTAIKRFKRKYKYIQNVFSL